MRGQKTFTIDGRKPVEVYELTYRDIESLLDFEKISGEGFDALLSHFGGNILPLCCNYSLEEVQALAPSEIKQIWDAVQEVNATFFDIVRTAGIADILERLKAAVLSDFLTSAASSLSGAITTPGATDTAS